MTYPSDTASRPKRSFVLSLPVPMPTWNRLLAMNPWERKRVRDLLHQFVSLSVTFGNDWPTLMVYQGKQCSTASLIQRYLRTIRPSTSKRSATRK